MTQDIFDNEEHDEAAKAKELRTLFNTIHKLVNSGRWSIYYDREGFISRVEWSDDFRHMLGYNDESDFPNTLGAWSRLLHPDDWEVGYDSIDKTIADRSGKTPYDVEYRLNTKSRGYRWFRAAGDVYRREDGSAYRFFGVFIDIDDKKKHEELEAQKERAMQRAQDATQSMRYIQAQYDIIQALSNDYVSIYSVQPEIDIVDVLKLESFVVKGLSSTAKGLKYSTLIGGYCEGRVHPDDKTEFLRATSCKNIIEQLKKSGQYEITYRIFVAGEVHHFLARYIRTSTKDQAVKAIIGFRNVDMVVSEDRRHHDIMQESTALTAIHESLGSGNWAMKFDKNGKLSDVNWSNKFRRMLGYNSISDFPNTLNAWSDLLHKDDSGPTLKAFYGAIEDTTGKKTYDVQYRLLTRNQGYRWFHAAGRVVRRADSTPDTFYGVFIDIDEEKKRDIMLRDALSMSEKASIAKTTFLNNMSHDIRTPMNAIIGFTTLALTHIGDIDKTRDYLQKIQTSSNHLLSLINDVLDMSRIESGKIVIEKKAASIKKIVDDIKTIVESTILTKGLKFSCVIGDIKNDIVLCDVLRLNQVLLNLLSNAIKFTKSGGTVSLKVDQIRIKRDGCAHYRFCVEDTGIGIGSEFLPHVFESFERERTATISGIQGTGLGLAIAKSIVDMMGGTIKVDSAKGKGTIFTVLLKMSVIDSDKAANGDGAGGERLKDSLANQSKKGNKDNDSGDQNNTLKIATFAATKIFNNSAPFGDTLQDAGQDSLKDRDKGAGSGGLSALHKSILLVEDNELNMQIAQEILQEYGFNVTVAHNGQEALTTIEDSDAARFDLVLMDVQMPIMNGYDATRAIRLLGDKDKAAIPIVAMTADAFEEDKQKALAAGMNDHIAKPINIKTLLEVIGRVL